MKTARSIHAYLTEEEHEQVDRTIEKLRTVGKGAAKINKGDVGAALLMVAIEDINFIAKVRAYLTTGE